jgi:hypothetical protein
MDTQKLFYYIYKNNVTVEQHYLPWALCMLEKDYESPSLYILASLQSPYNIFEVEEYFKRTIGELKITIPSEQECIDYMIYTRLQKITQDEDMAITEAYELYNMFCELDCPEELVAWVYISDLIDNFQYEDNDLEVTEEVLLQEIIREAKNQLKKYSPWSDEK